MVTISSDCLETIPRINLSNYECYERKLKMNRDTLKTPPGIGSRASPVDESLPSQTLTKSDMVESNYQDVGDDAHPFGFASGPRVQPLYSTDAYFLQDYSGRRQQRLSYSPPTPVSLYPKQNFAEASYVNYANPHGESTRSNESRHRNDPQHLYPHYHLNISYAQPSFPVYQPSTPFFNSPEVDGASNVFRGHYDLSNYPPHIHQGHFISSVDDSLQQIDENEINPNDVLCGRGGLTNTHSGNRTFRTIVKAYQEQYIMAKKKDKPLVAEFIVKEIRAMTPPGRFIKKNKSTRKWTDVGDKKAIEKTCQALREGASKLRERMEPMMKTTFVFTPEPSTAVCDVQSCGDEDKKRGRDFSSDVPTSESGRNENFQDQLEEGVQYNMEPARHSCREDDDYVLKRPDSFEPIELLNYELGDTIINQSPIRMLGSWDVYRSPSWRKKAKSEIDVPLDGNFFAPPRSAEIERRDRTHQERPQPKSV